MFGDVKVFWIIKGRIKSVLDATDNSRLKIDKKGSRDVVVVICLIEKHIFSVITLGCELFQHTISADAVLHAQLFPKLIAD